jgi:hypothetical protein
VADAAPLVADDALAELNSAEVHAAISTALEVPWLKSPDAQGGRDALGLSGLVLPASTVQILPAEARTDVGPALEAAALFAQAPAGEPQAVEPPPVAEPSVEVGPPAEPQPPPLPEPPFDDPAPGEPPGSPAPDLAIPVDDVPSESVEGSATPPVELGWTAPPCPCGPGNGGAACTQLVGCHEDSGEAFPSSVQQDILELFAVDIARRSLLALHPYAAKEPVLTLDVVVRPSGHIVHTYARLQWHRRHWWNVRGPAKVYQTEVSASIVYHPDRRRVFDVSYVDNAYLPFRNIDMTSQVTASYNEDFALRDGTGLPPKFLSDRVDVLEPYVEPRIFNFGPVREPDPRAKQLRVVRRDSNVTANQ